MKLLIELELYGKGLEKVPIKIRVKNLFKYGIYNFKFYSNPIDEVLDYLYYLYYKNKENEINNDIERIERELKIFNFDNELKEYSNNALKIFKELDLIVPNIDGDIVTVSRGGNYYSKCNLEDSKIYLKETVKE